MLLFAWWVRVALVSISPISLTCHKRSITFLTSTPNYSTLPIKLLILHLGWRPSLSYWLPLFVFRFRCLKNSHWVTCITVVYFIITKYCFTSMISITELLSFCLFLSWWTKDLTLPFIFSSCNGWCCSFVSIMFIIFKEPRNLVGIVSLPYLFFLLFTLLLNCFIGFIFVSEYIWILITCSLNHCCQRSLSENPFSWPWFIKLLWNIFKNLAWKSIIKPCALLRLLTLSVINTEQVCSVFF